MAGLVIVSNGHGEDAIGAALARELHRLAPDLSLVAYPLVGAGRAYEDAPVALTGPRQELPSAGLTVHTLDNLIADLRAGWLPMTGRQLVDLARMRADALLVVGDLYAQLLAATVRAPARFVVQPLVSVRQAGAERPPLHRIAMERFTLLERWLLARRADRVYARDEPTAAWLREHGVASAVFLGQPAMDAVAEVTPGALPATAGAFLRLALLPGSREHANRSLAVMLGAVERLDAVATVAWARSAPPDVPGWAWSPADAPGARGRLERGSRSVLLTDRDLVPALDGAQLALATTGTAAEQAAAAGLPVLSFPVPPEHTRAFLAGQRRLLGPALTVVPTAPDAVAAAVRELAADPVRYRDAARAGRERMGGPGGTRAIARDLVERLGRRDAPAGPST